jgi:site-specific recombinase XerD
MADTTILFSLPCITILIQLDYSSRPVQYLSKDEMQLILEQPDISTRQGRRDATIISLLYDTGARVQELCDLTVKDIRLDGSQSARIFGKGRKIRLVPLLPDTIKLIRTYLEENRLTTPEKGDYPLFVNRSGSKFTRAGIKYILNKAAQSAARTSPHIPKSLTPHILRHTKAMHTYEAGANIIYVRDILGHADIKTTNVYAKASLDMKRKAMEKVAGSPSVTVPSWLEDPDLVDWLKKYGRVVP